MSEDRGIIGIKKSEWIEPDKLEKHISGPLPEGVRLYVKDQSVEIPNSKVKVQLYQLFDEGGFKDRKVNVEVMNRIPEEDEIGLRHGPGDYLFIAKWIGVDGKPTGIASDRISIGEAWREKHEEYCRKQTYHAPAPAPAPESQTPSTPAANTAVAVSDALPMGGALSQMEGVFAVVERLAAIMQRLQPPSPTVLLEKAYEGAGKIMDSAMRANLENLRRTSDRLEEMELRPGGKEDDEDEDEDEDEDDKKKKSSIPTWLEPFMPQIKSGLDKLLSGGPVGKATKTILLNSDEFQSVFSDPEKWSQAVEAMRAQFGNERTDKALKILLAKKPEKKVVAKERKLRQK